MVVRENKILCGCEREQDFMWLRERTRFYVVVRENVDFMLLQERTRF